MKEYLISKNDMRIKNGNEREYHTEKAAREKKKEQVRPHPMPQSNRRRGLDCFFRILSCVSLLILDLVWEHFAKKGRDYPSISSVSLFLFSSLPLATKPERRPCQTDARKEKKIKIQTLCPDALKQMNAMLDHSSCSRGAAREREREREKKKR